MCNKNLSGSRERRNNYLKVFINVVFGHFAGENIMVRP